MKNIVLYFKTAHFRPFQHSCEKRILALLCPPPPPSGHLPVCMETRDPIRTFFKIYMGYRTKICIYTDFDYNGTTKTPFLLTSPVLLCFPGRGLCICNIPLVTMVNFAALVTFVSVNTITRHKCFALKTFPNFVKIHSPNNSISVIR